MEDDSGVKAPVTRLRRRLSVEQSEESKSPAPNTPTKARRGRRKPELELIEENGAAKTTPMKTVTKDIVEEEKPLTPSRRSARIRSNTSIVSETAVVDSPRAKRAARRLSQVGSDTEGPATPVRQTRRTRKDSTSSIDKAENQVAAKQKTIPEPITEENETNKQQPVPNTSDETNDSNMPVRKSPRLQEKKGRNSKTSQSPEKSINEDLNKTKNNVTLGTKDSESTEASDNQASKTNDLTTISPVKGSDRLSIGSAELLESVNVKPSKKTSSLNKSTSALTNLISESKRSRTKSCSVSLSVAATDDISNQFYSDSESTKKRKSNSRSPLKQLNISGSNKSLNKSPTKEKSFTEIPKNEAPEPVMQLNISGSNKSLNKSSNQEKSFTEFSKNEATEKDQSDNSNDIQDIFKQKPSSDMRVTIITFGDNDSNHEKLNRAEDDQCVPEVEHVHEKSNKINETKEDNSTARKNSINDSCEPMDVDETIPDHLLIDHSQKINDKSMQSPQKSKRKSSFGLNLDASVNHNKSNSSGFAFESGKQNMSSSEANTSKQNTSLQSSKESKRKSSINQSFNESENQNKSTLVLSYLKDIPESETNKSSKSPQQLNDKRLSNSTTVLNITQENIVSNKNLSLCYSTSTPLQQKGNRGINVNTSNIKSPGENKLLVNKTKYSDSDSDSSESNKTKGNESKLINQKSDSSSSDGESSQEKNDLMDDEAEDAGDDYESGDSQDEEEREEALANEIREKGETLTSEEELSDDSDYEKDSFIVSSAEEDNELLEGTEDDLSMSDNELNMSKKSKQKFNERKLKEQKKASREMFESRHQINNSKTEKKKKRIQLNSSSESESDRDDDEVKKPSKAKTRQILDSSADITSNSQGNALSKRKSQSMRSSESDYEDIKPLKTKNKQRLDSEDINVSKEDSIKLPKRNKTPSQSICNESIVENNEKEISFNMDQVENECDPLSQSIKKEPKRPLKENMSLAFIDAQNANMSIKDSNKLDPLASTIANDDDEVDSSMSSDNERIVQDYDSILEGLNKANKIKSVDTSLNFEKRTKKKDKEPIVDHLNLTQVKGKKTKNKMEVPKNDKSKETEALPLDKDESSSDSESALMNLLFSEESNHCDDANTKNEDDSNNYIPLKRVAGKTDIHDCGPQENDQSNKTPKDKKKKNRTLSESSFTNKSDSVDGGVPFFIDTEGTNAQNTSLGNKSLHRSKISVSEKDNDSDSDAPMEVSFKKDKNLSNSKMDNLDEGSLNISSSTGSSKKKKKQNMNSSNIEIKVTSDSKKTESAKKKNKKTSISLNESITATEKVTSDSEKTESAKKNKKTSISLNESITATEKDTIESTETLNIKTPGSGKKIRKNSNVDSKDEIDADELTINKSISKTPSSDKKKSKKSIDVASEETNVTVLDTSLITSNGKKKQKKISENSQNDTEIPPIPEQPGSAKKIENNDTENKNNAEGESRKLTKAEKRKRKRSSLVSEEDQKDPNEKEALHLNKQKKVKLTPQGMMETEKNLTELIKETKSKKRKEREDDNIEIIQPTKESSLKKVQVSRLPTSVLEQLDDKPRQEEPKRKKSKLIATTDFIVEETKIRKNKPSMFLEESIYLNEDEKELKKQKAKSLKPKVLPFVPTASTSISGYTTNFKVNVIPRDTKFVAQSNNVTNFKSEYLYGKKIKRNGTYEMYKRSRNVKLSKF
ncbi:dentin sialophosphoprotein isoform X2 [Aricia agestis]|uniref:dentin sialophosphoprotein isoform X2 n=1 Tax=Aricia agestis TaxID=91739 RepID=UPI001C206584|nr:dentin sialophosphoprotein isoform X2 [Aricia agestis]